MNKYLTFIGAIAVLVFIVLIGIRYRKLTLPRSYNDIDEMNTLFNDIRVQLPTSRKIGFATDKSIAEREVELYFKSAFLLAPTVVELAPRDTMVFVYDPKLPILQDDQYKTILTLDGKNLSYKLICKEW